MSGVDRGVCGEADIGYKGKPVWIRVGGRVPGMERK